jgi:ubiquitin carboxyl-terminal hydrolase 2/21
MSTPLETSGGYGGLVNMGLTCYANATIQAIRHASPRFAWLLQEGHYTTLFKKEEEAKPKRKLQQAFTRAFAEVVQMLGKCQRGQQVRPGDLWNKVRPAVEDTMYEHFAMKAPHDSHEFFLFLLESIHEATAQSVEMKILRPPPTTEEDRLVVQALGSWQKEFSKEYSPFVDMFYGLSHWRTTCQGCGTVSHRWESFNSLKGVVPKGGLSVDPPTLLSMLEGEMEPETVEGYHCDKCPERTTASRRFHIWRLPQVLLLVLKRFTPDGRKIHTRVAGPPAGPIDFAPYFSPESPEKGGITRYTLRSIVDHHGGATGGHYTAQAFHRGDDKWYLYDDESIADLPGGPMFGDSTYMLFLERN